jgi:hypothetical protein
VRLAKTEEGNRVAEVVEVLLEIGRFGPDVEFVFDQTLAGAPAGCEMHLGVTDRTRFAVEMSRVAGAQEHGG